MNGMPLVTFALVWERNIGFHNSAFGVNKDFHFMGKNVFSFQFLFSFTPSLFNLKSRHIFLISTLPYEISIFITLIAFDAVAIKKGQFLCEVII